MIEVKKKGPELSYLPSLVPEPAKDETWQILNCGHRIPV
jgi:hypothetical protein